VKGVDEPQSGESREESQGEKEEKKEGRKKEGKKTPGRRRTEIGEWSSGRERRIDRDSVRKNAYAQEVGR
jgi:hypothetical protein